MYNKLNRGNPYVRKEDHGDMEFQNYWSYFNNIEQKMSILLKNLITLQLCRKKEKDNVCLIHSALLSLCNRNWLCICDFIYSLQIFLILLAENFKKSQNQFGHELYAENSKIFETAYKKQEEEQRQFEQEIIIKLKVRMPKFNFFFLK